VVGLGRGVGLVKVLFSRQPRVADGRAHQPLVGSAPHRGCRRIRRGHPAAGGDRRPPGATTP
jgi:hypothetical protein